MQPDAQATKRDLNEMAEAIMEDVGGRIDEVGGRIDKVGGRIDTLERLLRLVAIRVGITEPEIEEALQ